MIARRIVVGIAAAFLASCAGRVSEADFAQMDRVLEAAAATSGARAAATLANEGPRLRLPVADHASAVQYCALLHRALGAPREGIVALQARAGLRNTTKTPPEQVIAAVGFGDLFPLVRETPSFASEATPQAGSSARTFVSMDYGACTVLTVGEPGAGERTRRWLQSSTSGWRAAGGAGNHWRRYRVAPPSAFENDLVLLDGKLTDEAREAGVTAVDVVAQKGLP